MEPAARPIDPRWPWMTERQRLQERIAGIEADARKGGSLAGPRSYGGGSPPPASSTIRSAQKRTKRGPRDSHRPGRELRQRSPPPTTAWSIQHEAGQARAALRGSSAVLASLKNSRMLRRPFPPLGPPPRTILSRCRAAGTSPAPASIRLPLQPPFQNAQIREVTRHRDADQETERRQVQLRRGAPCGEALCDRLDVR